MADGSAFLLLDAMDNCTLAEYLRSGHRLLLKMLLICKAQSPASLLHLHAAVYSIHVNGIVLKYQTVQRIACLATHPAATSFRSPPAIFLNSSFLPPCTQCMPCTACPPSVSPLISSLFFVVYLVHTLPCLTYMSSRLHQFHSYIDIASFRP